jgi:hypothetical protein
MGAVTRMQRSREFAATPLFSSVAGLAVPAR